MLHSNTLQVLTTIAQHPAGRDLHLRNLHWALEGLNRKIGVFTFVRFDFQPMYDEKYIVQEGDHDTYYDFHGNRMPRMVMKSNARCFLLMQQDMFFTRQVTEIPKEMLLHIAAPHGGYFSVYDADRKFLYPRLWEGGIFYPTSFLKEVVQDGVSLGYMYRWAPGKTLPGLYFSHNQYFGRADEWILTPPEGERLGDKMTDLTLYAAYKKSPYRVDSEMIVHFSGPEHTHKLYPRSYHDIDILFDLAEHGCDRVSKTSAHNTAFLFLLAGVLCPSKKAAKLLTYHKDSWHYKNFVADVERMTVNYREWMSPSEIKTFEWAWAVIQEETPPDLFQRGKSSPLSIT